MCIDANINLGDDVIESIDKNLNEEENPLRENILGILLDNFKIAKEVIKL